MFITARREYLGPHRGGGGVTAVLLFAKKIFIIIVPFLRLYAHKT